MKRPFQKKKKGCPSDQKLHEKAQRHSQEDAKSEHSKIWSHSRQKGYTAGTYVLKGS